ncbi:hypothetical protein LCGC14_2413450, partial [marine sediment metagenome]
MGHMSIWDEIEQEQQPVSVWDEVETEFVADKQESSYAKQLLGSLAKGGMRIGQAVLEMPKHVAWMMMKVEGASPDIAPKPGDKGYLLYKEELEKMERDPAYKPVGVRHLEVIKQYKQGKEVIIKAHPEWE